MKMQRKERLGDKKQFLSHFSNVKMKIANKQMGGLPIGHKQKKKNEKKNRNETEMQKLT